MYAKFLKGIHDQQAFPNLLSVFGVVTVTIVESVAVTEQNVIPLQIVTDANAEPGILLC